MFNPIATYRIQFHKHFNFDALLQILPYLQQLGVKTIYASPIFMAVPGSTHGYDITDPNVINPEIGSIEQLYEISRRLKKNGMSWMQDIVPNHMAVHHDNKWLMDVLKKGPASAFASYFDIDWQHPCFHGKLMLPILSQSLQESIASGALELILQHNELVLKCNGHYLPVSSDKLNNVNPNQLEEINKDANALAALIQQQHYILTPHTETNRKINYRRFFTINGLISLNMQHREVFNSYHLLIKQLCDDDIFQGLRVDHVDGLFNPTEYLFRLRELAGKDMYIVVEKILAHEEQLPGEWDIAGTTGYDFLACLNNIIINAEGKKKLDKYYQKIAGERGDLSVIAREKKLSILHKYMQGDLDNIYRIATTILEHDKSIASDQLKPAIAEFLARFPVYRHYGHMPLTGTELATINTVISDIAKEPHFANGAKQLSLLLTSTNGDSTLHSIFYRRCMQLTGPLMAKGIEDTLMYTWNSFIGQNEVGDHPARNGYNVEKFHQLMQQRQYKWPLAINASATHDTKRGEDARARLAMITEAPEDWLHTVAHWHAMAEGHLGKVSANDEYLIYQALLAAWPIADNDKSSFKTRFTEYIRKAVREGKVNSNWQTPNEQYEQDITTFAHWLLEQEEFRLSMDQLLQTLADGSTVAALVQVILKFTCPGIPDVYQGNELWDFSMVDPDNRRAVDYEERLRRLNGMQPLNETAWRDLWSNSTNGSIKMALTRVLLTERANHPKTFSGGEYIPLDVRGTYKNHLLAYARRHGYTTYVIIVPLHLSPMTSEQRVAITDLDWKDTTISLPASHGKWKNLLTSEEDVIEDTCLASRILTPLPFAMFKSIHESSKRSSGILLPIFSLATSFGIGDFGEGAFRFIDFLQNSHQRYWQLLPLNPTVTGEAHSPYSSISGMALNTLFIAPTLLVLDGLLSQEEIRKWELPASNTIDYARCKQTKEDILQLAWERYNANHFERMQQEFEVFCEEHAHWLNDFALYVCIKQAQNYEPWHNWSTPYRERQPDAIASFAETNASDIKKIKWLQYQAARQWGMVRRYACLKGISLFGDMPFYMSYDSVDVWAHPELFCLDADGKMTGIAGVPPDYFSKTGQLWNMPTYNWGALKATNYKWWIERLKRNLQLFDLVRIDHFRAFQAYWQIEPGNTSAEFGSWKEGPGIEFFNVAREQISELPLVAEDLGEEMEDVYQLRDKTGLPGMKVLQFAWGDNMPTSVDVPHNHTENSIVYTGTHDNNTTLGWWMDETTEEDKKRFMEYTGQKINASNVHMCLLRVAYASVARVAIAPIQDVLGLGSEARINIPGTGKGNWTFRLQSSMLTPEVEHELRCLVSMYNRY